jgi:integrin-linked kinase-associated serine/threonine phosphatase 2C
MCRITPKERVAVE